MPILSNRPKEPTPEPQTPTITTPHYKSPVVDTRFQSRKSLLSHAEGMPWVVTYYQQMIAEDSELSPQQLAKDPVYQQYTKIQNLEIRVTNDLNQTQDLESSNFEVTGAAILFPPLRPNKGDMFLADIGDGREGVFAITDSRRLSIMKETCFEVEYVLVSHSSEERRQDLEQKTIKRTHFVKRLLEHGESPIVIDEQYHQYLSLQEYWGRLLGQYMGQFYHKATSTLLVPNQKQTTYDPFIVKFIAAFISSTHHPLLRHTKKYSVDLPNRNQPYTLWDAILTVSDALLPMVEEKLTLVPSPVFGQLPQYESIYFSNVSWVVYPHNPKEPLFPAEGLQRGQHKTRDIRHQFDTTRLNTLSQYPPLIVDGVKTLPPIYPVTMDDYYVLSKNFYHGKEGQQSHLEQLVQLALARKPIDQQRLTELCEQCHKWTQLEQFYYVPLLLVLIKMVLRGQ